MLQTIIHFFLQGICREQAGGFRPLYQFADYNWCGRHVQRLVICPKTKDLKRWNYYKFCIPFHKCIRSVTMLFENDVYSTVNSSVNTSCYPQNIISFWNTYCRIFSCILDAYSKYVCKNPLSCVVERKTSTKTTLWISTSQQITSEQLIDKFQKKITTTNLREGPQSIGISFEFSSLNKLWYNCRPTSDCYQAL